VKKYYVHPQAICESNNIGSNTRIWAFTHVLPNAVIGTDCNICDGVFIENNVLIGDRVTVKCGVQLWDGLVVEDDVFIGPNVTFTNDRFPHSKDHPNQFLNTTVRKRASIGANATILPGLEIGAGAMIGAGTVVIHSVPPNAIAVGNPARIIRYAGTKQDDNIDSNPLTIKITTGETNVKGVSLHEFPFIKDMRGNLSVGEFERTVPFIPKRYFLVFDVPNREVRGEHAHYTCHQFLICIKGSCAVVADDGKNRQEFFLNRPNIGLYLPPMIWGTQYKYSNNAVLLVFASEYYNVNDYIRNYSKFITLVDKNA